MNSFNAQQIFYEYMSCARDFLGAGVVEIDYSSTKSSLS